MAKRKAKPITEDAMDGIFPFRPKYIWALQEPTAVEKELLAEQEERPLDVESYEREIRNLIRPRLEPREQPRNPEDSTAEFLIDFGEGRQPYRLHDGLTQDQLTATLDGIGMLHALEKVRTLGPSGAVKYAFTAGVLYTQMGARRCDEPVRQQRRVGKAATQQRIKMT